MAQAVNDKIAIVGAGPSGLALAGILERTGLDYVVFERTNRETPPRGGSLDLHPNSGQLAMREAGCAAGIEKYGRLGDYTTHRVFDHNATQVFSWGEGEDSPEFDRHEIKSALLTAIPSQKLQWQKTLKDAYRDDSNQIVLAFDDGSSASGFTLVVGADGIWSKIRPLVNLPRDTSSFDA